ncbi:MAG: FAD-dependent oxidoreductase [Oligoflexia bacterium]|nr:FAD-dependent oxidoreductase [Oligoflexia bacterium]MBF0364576.1 FAD-dependent oxidoreductase [Oligoflexia bacterium]
MMSNHHDSYEYRIKDHPVLDFEGPKREVAFNFEGKSLQGIEGEPILVALASNGIIKLKEGAKKHTPYGPFCMQGRCCSCAMHVNGKPNVMTCVTPLEEGMSVHYMGGEDDVQVFKRLPIKRIDISPSGMSQAHPKCDIAIIGAGPAGLEAAITAARAGVKNVVLFDDKPYLGGQLALQTHTFFGTKELGASIRGYEIANQMKKDLANTSVDVRPSSTVVGLYPQNMLAFRDEDRLNFIVAKKVILATGASEKFASFEGNCLPGVMGAGGAQTLMNLYGVRPGKRVLIIGGGNIGVILAYQLIQAGVEVAAIVEGMDHMGAYEVHVKKVQALGVPIYTRHTLKRARGKDRVEGATIVALDDRWQWITGSEKELEVDTICLAVGLAPLNELLWQADCEFTYIPELGEVPAFDKFRQTSNKDIFIAGDCAVIGEASIARLEGRIAGLKAALDLGHPHPEFNFMVEDAFRLLDNIEMGTFGKRLGIGKSKVNGMMMNFEFVPKNFNQQVSAESFVGKEKKVLISCTQDIPCNPCESSCHLGAISIGDKINQQPSVNFNLCKGCGLCVPACPGRAIRILQYNYSDTHSALTLPFEFLPYPQEGHLIDLYNAQGQVITKGSVHKLQKPKQKTDCGTITVLVEKQHAFTATAVDVHAPSRVLNTIMQQNIDKGDKNSNYICRCEEVTYDEIIALIRRGYTTINELKRLTRVGMGQCRGMSCTNIIEGILKRELKKSPEDILEIKRSRRSIFRPPVKRITLGEAAKLKFSQEEIALFEGIEQVRTIPQEIVNTYLKKDVHLNEEEKKQQERAKIVIIGGGINGVMTAWWLAKMGEADVIVLESNFLSSGKTGAALGGIRTGFNTSNKVERAKKGLEVYKNSKELIGEDVGWHQGGYVYLAFDENQKTLFKKSIPTWESSKVPFTLTEDRAQFDRYVPGIDYTKVTSLVHFPEAGGANPFRATYMFAEDAKKRGVRFYNNSEVVSVNVENNQVKGLYVFDKQSKAHRYIECDSIVNAAGTAAVRVAKMVGIDLSSQIWIERHGAFITEKMPLWLDPLIVSYHPTLSGYWQQKRMEANVNEGEFVACYSPEHPIKGLNTHSYIYFLARMAKAMLLCQPALSDVGIIRNFSEHYVGRQSGIPMIGKTPVKGFYLNVAKKGHGFMCAPGDGLALAHTILEGKTHPWISECTIEEHKSDLKETMK